MKRSTCLFFLILFNACNPDKSKQIGKKGINFSTNDASEMFYNNIRRSDYDIEEKEGTKLKVYRHQGYKICPRENCVLKIAIVHNWVDNLAYTLLELPDSYEQKVQIVLKKDGEADTLSYAKGDIKEQLFFITDIYNGLVKQWEVYDFKSGELSLWTFEEKEAFRVTCADFYRLVNAYEHQ